MGKFFGTDGIRAVAGKYPLVKDFVEKLGYVAFCELSKNGAGRNGIFIGRDTRESGSEISKWLFYGLRAAGAKKVIDLGICPTPAVSYLTKEYNALFGIVISASHNPAEYNGIKFFDSNGNKISAKTEQKIETLLENTSRYPFPEKLQEIKKESLTADYVQFLIDVFAKSGNPSLEGLKIILDCANGASYEIAPRILRNLKAEIITASCENDGKKINLNCGALHIENIQDKVKKYKADVGISLDGDADRAILTDELGRKFDGDDIIAMAAVELKRQDKLKSNKVVLTVMSNAGLISYLKQNDIKTEIVPVGDRHITEKLKELNLNLGGETSGHIIFSDFTPTGDGLLTSLQILSMLKKSGKPLSYFKDIWIRYPSVLKAVSVDKKIPLSEISGFEEKRKMLEQTLGNGGRIFVRYSGTEPKLRILAEGPDASVLNSVVREIINYYKRFTKRSANCR